MLPEQAMAKRQQVVRGGRSVSVDSYNIRSQFKAMAMAAGGTPSK